MDNAPSPDASRCLQEVAPHPAAPRGGCSRRGAAEGLHLLGGTPQPLCTLQEEAASLVLARCGAGSLRWVSRGCQPRFLGQTAGCVTKGPENRFFCLAALLPSKHGFSSSLGFVSKLRGERSSAVSVAGRKMILVGGQEGVLS